MFLTSVLIAAHSFALEFIFQNVGAGLPCSIVTKNLVQPVFWLCYHVSSFTISSVESFNRFFLKKEFDQDSLLVGIQKVKQPLQYTDSQEKEKNEKHIGKLIY